MPAPLAAVKETLQLDVQPPYAVPRIVARDQAESLSQPVIPAMPRCPGRRDAKRWRPVAVDDSFSVEPEPARERRVGMSLNDLANLFKPRDWVGGISHAVPLERSRFLPTPEKRGTRSP